MSKSSKRAAQIGEHWSGPKAFSRLNVDPGSRGDRFFAALIDSVIIGAIASLLALVFGDRNFNLEILSEAKGSLVFLAVLVGYYTILEGGGRQATFGKQILKLAVVSADGSRLSYGRAFVRALARLIGIGWFVALFDDDNRALHDYVAGSVVVEPK